MRDAIEPVVKVDLMADGMVHGMDSPKVDEMVRLKADMWVTLLVHERDAKEAVVKVVLRDAKVAVV